MIYMPSLASLLRKQMWSFYWLQLSAAKLVIRSAFPTKCHNSRRKYTFQGLHILFYMLKEEGKKGIYYDTSVQGCLKHLLVVHVG